MSIHIHPWLLPAPLRAINLLLHVDGLTEEAVDVFEIQTAVCHALHGTVKTSTSMQALTGKAKVK